MHRFTKTCVCLNVMTPGPQAAGINPNEIRGTVCQAGYSSYVTAVKSRLNGGDSTFNHQVSEAILLHLSLRIYKWISSGEEQV